MRGSLVKEMSAEHRALIAAFFALLVIFIWEAYFYKPPQPQPGKPSAPAPTEVAKLPAPAAAAPAAPAPVLPPRAATAERTIVVESDLYRVELSNRGATVRRWLLKKYTDDSTPPRTLDLVHPETAQQLGGWPFSLVLSDPQLESQVNSALFDVTPANATLEAPAEVDFVWSNGEVSVTKRLKFDRSYVVHVETSVTRDGRPVSHSLAWRGGFGDRTVYRAAQSVEVVTSQSGKINTLAPNKLGKSGQPAERAVLPGPFEFAGIEDHYFVAAFLPPLTALPGATQATQLAAPDLTLTDWTLEREVQAEGKTEKEPVAEMAAGTSVAGPLELRVFVGPKIIDELRAMNPPLNGLVQFGWWGFIAEPLFRIMRWLHGYVPNYGWAIVLLTIGINTVLFPLRVKSWRSMQKMQRVAPEIKAIQERYKKYSMRDPRKQEMNKEVMAVYSREGINPLGGCLPMVLQMPIWIGLYRMLQVAIELRHAPWIGWIHDLSARDPYYILPILMTVTMYVTTKMTPATTTDPTQQKMMTLMPLFFGVLFFTLSSGLVLYIFTSNLVAMVQQWYLNRTAPPPVKARPGRRT